MGVKAGGDPPARPADDAIAYARTLGSDTSVLWRTPASRFDATVSSSGEATDAMFIAWTLPADIARHTLIRQIGIGGMGQVFEARAPDGTAVALKIIRGATPERLYRFKREFRALSAVVHPNIVALYDLVHAQGSDEFGLVFFTMELLRGQDFVAHVRGDRKLGEPLDDAALRRLQDALVGLACGLAGVHQHGLVHRDIKPSNVMVTDTGRVVVLDLGLVQERADLSLEGSGRSTLVGTPLYMAPEQALGSAVGPASDWYAVGEVLWECLVGESRHKDSSSSELFERKFADDPSPPSQRQPGVPPRLDRLCVDLLARRPEARPAASEVLARLDRHELVAAPLAAEGLLGREAEVRTLRSYLLEPRGGAPNAVFVSGPSGFGKTTLIDHVLAAARGEDGLLAFSGSCSERESIAFKALDSAIDALALHLRGRADDDASSLHGGLSSLHGPPGLSSFARPEDLAALARLFPVLRTVPAIRGIDESATAGCDPVEIRRRAADAFAGVLARIAADHPVVLDLDDLQWADLDSVLFLHSVLLRKPAPPVTLLVSHREGAEATRHPLAHLIAGLTADPGFTVHRLAIGPLGPEQSTTLAARLLGGRSGDPVAERIAREAQGSPFFVGELVRHVLARGGLDDDAVSLDSVLRMHLQRLPAAARRLVEIVAVAGGRLPRAIALDVAASAGKVDRGTLARLRAEHLIRIAGASDDDILETYHDRVREAAFQDLAQAADAPLPAIHRAIGEALLRTGSTDMATLAHHFRAAKDGARAIYYTLAAAADAARALAFDQAAELYRAALAIGGLGAVATIDTRARLAEALANAGRMHAAARVYTDAGHDTSGAAGDPQRTEWLRLAATHFLTTGHHDEGRAVLDELLSRVGLSRTRGTVSTIVSLIGQRLRLPRKLGVPPPGPGQLSQQDAERLDVCWTATRGLAYVDGLNSALFHARHLRLALASGDPLRAARAVGYEAYVRALMQGVPVEAETHVLFDALEQSPAVQGSPYTLGMLAQFRAGTHNMLCRFAASATEYERAIAILRSQCTGQMHEVSQIEVHRTLLHQYRGEVGAVGAAAARLIRDCAERPNPYVEGFIRGMMGNVVHLAADQVEAATEQMALYREGAPRHFEVHYFNWTCQQSELLRYQGQALASWQQHLLDAPKIRRLIFFRIPFVQAEFHRNRGATALALAAQHRDPAPLLKIARKSAEQCLRLPLPTGEAFGRFLLASAEALAGRSEPAIAEARRAITAYEALGMTSYLAVMRRRLAALVGGDEGRELMALSDAWMTKNAIVRPDLYTDMNAAGFTRRP